MLRRRLSPGGASLRYGAGLVLRLPRGARGGDRMALVIRRDLKSPIRGPGPDWRQLRSIWWSGIAETTRSGRRSEDGDAVYLGGRIDRWDRHAGPHLRQRIAIFADLHDMELVGDRS